MANEKGKKKNNDKDKVILTPQKDGKTTVHIDGNLKGTLPSPESRIAPTASNEFTASSTEHQEENGSFAVAISRAAQLEIAEALSTGPETLTTLASSEIHAVRLAVAQNPYTPVDALLNLLVTGAEDAVLVAVASHKNTPAGILDKLAKNADWEVREAVASNSTQFDWDTIVDLAYDEDPEVTVALIRSGKIDKSQILTDIGLDSNSPTSVSLAAARHPGNYADVLDLFVSKYPSDPILMLAVVENPTTEEDTLERLLESEDHRVVAKAKVRLGINPSMAE